MQITEIDSFRGKLHAAIVGVPGEDAECLTGNGMRAERDALRRSVPTVRRTTIPFPVRHSDSLPGTVAVGTRVLRPVFYLRRSRKVYDCRFFFDGVVIFGDY